MCDHCSDTGLVAESAPCWHCKKGAKESVSRLFEENKRLKNLIKISEGDKKKQYQRFLKENTKAIERTRRKWHV